MVNEKRLIDANALADTFGNYGFGLDVRRRIELQPTVDALEVVRCKDCKHRADALACGNYLCNRKMLGMVRPNDFCSFGERNCNG